MHNKALDCCMVLLLDYSPWSCEAERSARDGKYHCFGCVRWHTNAPVWIVGRRDGVFVCEARVVWTRRWRSERTRPDPVGTWFGWVNNRQLGERIVFGEEKRVLGVIWQKEKKSLELRKRAIKPGTSWYSEKHCENKPVSTQLLASDVSRSNGNLSAGANSWPLTSAFGKPWQLPLTWVYCTKGQSELVTAEQRLKCKLSRIV